MFKFIWAMYDTIEKMTLFWLKINFANDVICDNTNSRQIFLKISVIFYPKQNLSSLPFSA